MRHLSRYSFAVIASALSYTIAFYWLTYQKYYTFHADFADLGLANQTQWLLLHGGPELYYSSGFANIYPLQFEKPITFLITPVYAIYPHPEMLLVIQAIAISMAAIPLYDFARIRLQNAPLATLVGIAYLVAFPVADATLFDFHYLTLTPLFFFTACAMWARKNRLGMVIAGSLCASVNPLALVTIAFFAIYVIIEPIHGLWDLPRRIAQRVRSEPAVSLFVVGCAVTLLLYSVGRTLYTAGTATNSSGIVSSLLYDVNSKVYLFLLLYGVLAFIPLQSIRSHIVLLPYVGFVLLSTDSAHWTPFGLMYPLWGLMALLFILVESLCFGGIRDKFHQPSSSVGVSLPDSTRELGSTRRRRHGYHFRMPGGRTGMTLVITTVLFSAIYFPFSPLNSSVTGGYFSGNENYATITQSTPSTLFLWKVIDLIPPNASVLTENDIPQLSGRLHYQVVEFYTSDIPYNYILMDTSISWFSPIDTILPFVDTALASGQFGVLAEGYGALLVEKNYHGPPKLFVPSDTNYLGANLNPYGGTRVVGSSLVGNTSSYSMWYGPFATLYPGTYSAYFVMETNRTASSSIPALTLDVTSADGSVVYASRPVYLQNFTATVTPTTFSLNFKLMNITTEMEFRGMFPSGIAQLSLLSVEVTQDRS